VQRDDSIEEWRVSPPQDVEEHLNRPAALAA
jgi:hypothetical protein